MKQSSNSITKAIHVYSYLRPISIKHENLFVKLLSLNLLSCIPGFY